MADNDLPFTMPLADNPSDHVATYSATFARGSAEQLDRHYEPDAVLVPRPGCPVTGAARLAAHDHLLGFGVTLDARTRHLYVAGDIALLIVDWSMRGTDPRDGSPIDFHGTATDVARRGSDGRWRYVIDNPFGTA